MVQSHRFEIPVLSKHWKLRRSYAVYLHACCENIYSYFLCRFSCVAGGQSVWVMRKAADSCWVPLVGSFMASKHPHTYWQSCENKSERCANVCVYSLHNTMGVRLTQSYVQTQFCLLRKSVCVNTDSCSDQLR